MRHAWLGLVLTRVRIRDDAWARMDPAHRDAHRRLWTDVVRRAQPGYVAGPASLLAFTAWQSGDGALANIALERALADTPGYSMALLLRDALNAGAPPSMATPPMTPDEVTASYAESGPRPPVPRAAKRLPHAPLSPSTSADTRPAPAGHQGRRFHQDADANVTGRKKRERQLKNQGGASRRCPMRRQAAQYTSRAKGNETA